MSWKNIWASFLLGFLTVVEISCKDFRSVNEHAHLKSNVAQAFVPTSSSSSSINTSPNIHRRNSAVEKLYSEYFTELKSSLRNFFEEEGKMWNGSLELYNREILESLKGKCEWSREEVQEIQNKLQSLWAQHKTFEGGEGDKDGGKDLDEPCIANTVALFQELDKFEQANSASFVVLKYSAFLREKILRKRLTTSPACGWTEEERRLVDRKVQGLIENFVDPHKLAKINEYKGVITALFENF